MIRLFNVANIKCVVMFVGVNPVRLLLIMFLILWHSAALSDDVSASMLKIERFSAERGDAQSQYFMGEHYELGDSGLARDLNIALNWYYKAADNGYAAAQYKIGLFHENGYAGLSGGMTAALPWYKKAAAGGYDPAKLKIEETGGETASSRRKTKETSQQKQERARMLRANKPAMAGLPLKVPQQYKGDNQSEKTISKLMAMKWFHKNHPAEYLPAKDMSCLRTSESEVTCFSEKRDRIIGKNRIGFGVKSVITGFNGDGGLRSIIFIMSKKSMKRRHLALLQIAMVYALKRDGNNPDTRWNAI